MTRMSVESLAIPDVKRIVPARFDDPRGFFSETFHAGRLAEHGIPGLFVQDNHSLSRAAGVIRGLHCQVAPHPQGKLVRCVRGAIWDVAVDIRPASPSYGRYVSALLSAENWAQLWIPPGFLHGFQTLEPNSEVLYKVTAPYDPATERGVRWNDPTLALPWKLADAPLLSGKDRDLPDFTAAADWFAAS